MSKAFVSALARVDAKMAEGGGAPSLALFDRASGELRALPSPERGVTDLSVPEGRHWLLLERSGRERADFRLDLREGSSLDWLNCRGAGPVNSRQVHVILRDGSRLMHRESLRLGVGESLGQAWHVEMAHPNSLCSIVTRLAQAEGSGSCLAYNATLAQGSEGSSYDQVAKSMKSGLGCSTLIEPNLIVQAKHVQAKHGASHAQVDPLSCHALAARGFSISEAHRILTQAFLDSAWDGVELGVEHRAFLEAPHEPA